MKRVSNSRVLVIGTTADYIGLMHRRFPGRALFLTDPAERARAVEPAPDPTSEVLCLLDQPEEAVHELTRHLARHGLTPGGVACFDCESMLLASHVARAFSLPYPSAQAIAACRSKVLSKQLWRRAGLPCPEVELVDTPDHASRFIERIGKPAILKPLTGSGSELLFVCTDANDCARAFDTIKTRLAGHWDARMYAPYTQDGRLINPRTTFAIEEFVSGTEYSCDFIIDDVRVDIIRIARKIPAAGHSAGTTLAYVLPADLPPQIGRDAFARQLRDAAHAVGLDRAICMIDIMIDGPRAAMIEIAPRPGGDCLPPLIRQSSGLDMLGLALDFAEQRPVAIPPPSQWRQLVGLRFFTTQAGVIRTIDDNAVREDPRVLECHLKRAPGHRVVQPPENYDSRLLGHAVFRPSDGRIEDECRQIDAKLRVEFESLTTDGHECTQTTMTS